MNEAVTGFEVHDTRFPTSERLDDSDAMNPDPDYSAAHLVLHTSDGSEGHGFCFTIGPGNGVVAAAIDTAWGLAARHAGVYGCLGAPAAVWIFQFLNGAIIIVALVIPRFTGEEKQN